MKVIDSETNVLYDVDGTLLLWTDPTVPGPEKIEFVYGGTTVYLTPHNYHINLLKSYKERGYHITVASANGFAWANTALKALNITEYVDVVMTKYLKYIDDTPADKWMNQVFIEDFLCQKKVK